MKQLVLASNNAGKLREFSALLATVDFEVLPQAHFNVPEAEEPHGTFVENAIAKARHAAKLTGLPALADDSGLVVDALKRKAQDEGSPGVKGRVIQLQGDEKLPACRARSEGFTEAIKAEPGIVLVHDAATGWEKAGAILRFKEALRLQKGFDAVYAHNDIIALGASEASVEEKVRESLLIVGTDGVTGPGGGLEMLGKNAIDATVHQPLLVDFAWRLVERMLKDGGFKPKPAYEIEPVVFTPKNLDELRARGLKVPEL